MKTNFYIIIILFLAILFSCSKKEETSSNESEEPIGDVVTLTDVQIKNAGIVIGTYSVEPITATIKASGKLEAPPQNVVTISAPFAGFVKSMDLLQGMVIKKGQAVAQLQHPDYITFQQNYVEQKSELQFLEVEYKRQEELAKDNINAQKSLQSAKANYEVAKAKTDGLKAKLLLMNLDINKVEHGEFISTINLYAPFHGYVTEVNVNLGQFVTPSDVILKIIDTQHLHAELKVFEKDVLKIKKGQSISFMLHGDTKTRKASVHLIGKEIMSDRTITIHGHLDEEDPELLPGMFLTAEILTNPSPSTVLPEEAVVSFEGESFVFTSEGSNKFKMTKVETGTSQNGKIEIQFPSNINEQTTLVLKGAYSLLSVLKNGGEE